MATLIQYMDSPSEDYTYFWVHTMKDGKEYVVSEVFKSEEEAKQWLEIIRKKLNGQASRY